MAACTKAPPTAGPEARDTPAPAPPPPAMSHVAPPPDAAVIVDAAPVTVRAGCVDPAADAEHRESGVKLAAWKLDLDGDGADDPAYVGYCSMMGGNCDVFLYVQPHGCARFVGQVQQTRVAGGGPRCVAPAAGGQPCRLTTQRMMIHGEIYEYFYAFHGTAYAEDGVGTQGPAPPH